MTNDGKLSRSRGKNNEYGTLYYIKQFLKANVKPGVEWTVVRIPLSGAAQEKGDIKIVVGGETEVLSLKESAVKFRTIQNILQEAKKDKIKAAALRGHGERYQNTMVVMSIEDYLKLRFKNFLRGDKGGISKER